MVSWFKVLATPGPFSALFCIYFDGLGDGGGGGLGILGTFPVLVPPSGLGLGGVGLGVEGFSLDMIVS